MKLRVTLVDAAGSQIGDSVVVPDPKDWRQYMTGYYAEGDWRQAFRVKLEKLDEADE